MSEPESIPAIRLAMFEALEAARRRGARYAEID